jgi:hypothetical protein
MHDAMVGVIDFGRADLRPAATDLAPPRGVYAHQIGDSAFEQQGHRMIAAALETPL